MKTAGIYDAQTFNERGVKALKTIGRKSLWLDEPEIVACLVEEETEAFGAG